MSEFWEIPYALAQAEDWPGLIQYWQTYLRRYPTDFYAQERLGNAYYANGDYQQAIDYLANIHRQEPHYSGIQHTILNALFALGKNENDFNWVIKPNVIRLNQALIDHMYQYLCPKRKPRSLSELIGEVCPWGYQAFTKQALFQALQQDERFDIQGQTATSAEVRVKRHRKSRTT